MEWLELAARVSQCGRTPPLHEQFRHHSRPGLWGMALGPLPDMLGLAEPGTTGAPSEPQPCRGMGASGRAQSGKGQRGSQCPPLGGGWEHRLAHISMGSDKGCCWGML